jgi:membrane fusion protein (multidrug efflux system)
MFTRLALGIAAVAVAYGAYDVLYASNHVETDNAYVGADTALITAQVVAPVREVLVSDTQMVKKATFSSALTTQMLDCAGQG